MEDEKLESVRRGIIDCDREIAMAESKGWDEIALDWTVIKSILHSRVVRLESLSDRGPAWAREKA